MSGLLSSHQKDLPAQSLWIQSSGLRHSPPPTTQQVTLNYYQELV